MASEAWFFTLAKQIALTIILLEIHLCLRNFNTENFYLEFKSLSKKKGNG